jgi:hypothetical protein
MKVEFYDQYLWPVCATSGRAVGDWIERVYNRHRRHPAQVWSAGLSFILGTRIPQLADVVREWRDTHPDEAVPDGLVLTQPWPATSA